MFDFKIYFTENFNLFSLFKKKSKVVLFIDDDIDNFPYVESLRNKGYVVHTLKEFTSLEDKKIIESDIIFVDYRGVGVDLDKKEQGFAVIHLIKNRFPKKRVIIYSAHSFTLKRNVHIADDSIFKNATLAEFIEKIEEK